MKVKCIDTFVEFQDLRESWNDLLAQSAADSPFMTHEWFATWWRCFGKKAQLHILQIEEDRKLVALVPLMLVKKTLSGTSLRILSFLANNHSGPTHWILGPKADEAVETVLQYLFRDFHHWDVLKLEYLPKESLSYRTLTAVLKKRGYLFAIKDSFQTMYVPISGTWDSYLASRSSKFRYTVRKKAREIEKVSGFEVNRFTRLEEVDGFMEMIFNIERKTWKEQAETSITARPELMNFYRSLAKVGNERGWLYFGLLKLFGQEAAYEYALNYKSKIYSMKISYDPAFAQYSPGQVLKAYILESAFEDGKKENDLLGNDEDWKQGYTSEARPLVTLYVFNWRPLPMLLYLLGFRMKEALQHRRWSEGLVQRLRRTEGFRIMKSLMTF